MMIYLNFFLLNANDFIEKRKLNITLDTVQYNGYYEIIGSGSDWGTRNFVLMITEMLENGITKCLIGTRALLGEGWDSIKLNTLIDLTIVSTFVSVNQIRGRTIRKDIDNPIKVANNWDIIAISNEIDRGIYDFERFMKKHSQFYGVSDDNIIEKGIGHVHPLLTNSNLATLVANKDKINNESFEKSLDRYSAYQKWKIGKAYNGFDKISMEIIPKEKNIRYQIPKAKEREINKYRFYLDKRKKQNFIFPILLSIIYLISSVLFINIPFSFSIIISSIIFILSFLFLFIFRINSFIKKSNEKASNDNPIDESLKSYSIVILKSLTELEIINKNINENDIIITHREDGSFRIFLDNCLNDDIFINSLSEVLSPIQNQKYLIERKELIIPQKLSNWLFKENLYKIANYHPVPNILSKNRKSADIFKKYWNEYISNGKLIYTRTNEGKKIVLEYFRKKQINIRKKEKNIWI